MFRLGMLLPQVWHRCLLAWTTSNELAGQDTSFGMELMHSLVDTTAGALQVCRCCLIGLNNGFRITVYF